jgi:hypothetical protein
VPNRYSLAPDRGEGWREGQRLGEHGQEGFLERWSRVKSEAREAAEEPAQRTSAPPATEAPPVLPPAETLTFESDFTAFFHPKVAEDVRRVALRRLFSDPHFNVMDGLDVYIDDYSQSEPNPAAMLAALNQAQKILDWSRNSEAEAAQHEAKTTTAPERVSNPDAPPPAGSAEVGDKAPSDDASDAGDDGERER